MNGSRGEICAVAIARDEAQFVEEWIAYHRLIGVDQFFLYDDDPMRPLENLLQRHRAYVSVIPWWGQSEGLPGRNRQTKAYTHFHETYASRFAWVTFIDIDEFITLREAPSLHDFLRQFSKASAVSLHWHVFGHSGLYDDPVGLVTETLTRRMRLPSRQHKSLTRPEAIARIGSAHACVLKPGAAQVDGNGRPFTGTTYEGITRCAHINHYQCRSFRRWMARVERGDVTVDPTDATQKPDRWRVDREACLRHFVETVAFDKNEHEDLFMRRYSDAIRRMLGSVPVPV